MKKGLILLLLLASFASHAQTVVVPVEIWNKVTNTFSYSVSAPRNYSTYPLTSQGKSDFEQAVVAGVFNLTTVDGCVIPVGTRPARTKPICNQPPSYTTIAVNYNQAFGVSGKGSGAEYVKGGTLDGIIKEGTLTWSGIDLPAPGSYSLAITYQSTTSVPTAQFSVNGGTAQSLPLLASEGELKTTSTTLTGFVQGSSNTIVMTPSGYIATASIALSKVGSVTVATPGSSNCDLFVSVNSPPASCSGTVTLSATTSGTDASGLTYSWSGPNGYSGAGQSVSVAPPRNNGTYSYVVTASKPGCSQQATAAVTVSGCASQTGSFAFQAPTSQSAWQSYSSRQIGPQNIMVKDYDAQESDELILQVWNGAGGSIQLIDKRQNNLELINFRDLGRESGVSSYGKVWSGESTPYWKTGYNPLQAGDSGGNPSTLLFHGSIDGYIYTKYQCNDWQYTDNRKLQFFYEQWARLDGNKVHVKVRITHANPDKAQYPARGQEWPFAMINGARISKFYVGDSPFTGGNMTSTNGIENSSTLMTNAGFPVQEPFMLVDAGSYNGQTRYFGLYEKNFYYGNTNLSDFSYSNTTDGPTITYVGSQPIRFLDSDNTWYFEYTLLVGTESEIRTWVYSQPRETTPNFSFTQANGRCRWYTLDGTTDEKEPFPSDDWKLTFTGKADPGQPLSARGTKLMSPYGAWQTGSAGTIYITMAYSGPETQLQLAWTLAGQEPSGINSSYPNQNGQRVPKGMRNYEQRKAFTIINDGQFHTYAVPLSSSSLYTGTVIQYELGYIPGSTLTPGDSWKLRYFGTSNPN